MLETVEVEPARWAAVLSEVATTSRARTAEVELDDPELGSQPIAERARLLGMSFDSKGSERGSVVLDLDAGGELEHRIVHVTRLFVRREAGARAIDALEVEAEDGSKTVLLFSPASTHHTVHGADVHTVRGWMSAPPIVLPTGSSLAEAFELMHQHDIRHLPIVSPAGQPVGLLSDRSMDLAKRERGIAPEDVTVDELMARDVFCVRPGDLLEQAAAALANRKMGCAVVTEDGRTVGVLSTVDVLRGLVHLRVAESAHP